MPRAAATLRHALVVLGVMLAGACQHAPGPVAAEPAPADVLVYDGSPFEAEIAAFEAADRLRPAARGGIVFVGSSSFRLWADLPQAFPAHPVVNRGFGGSTFPDLIRFAPRIVLPLEPATVVVYAGDNDLQHGRSPAQVLADYRTLAAILRTRLPKVELVVVSIKPSPSRWLIADRMREANRLLAIEVAADPNARFVDVFTAMLGADGQPRPELYGPDALHMSPAGYEIWRERIGPALD